MFTLKTEATSAQKRAEDEAFGSGKGRIKDILAELTRQDYDGYLTIEYENEKMCLILNLTSKRAGLYQGCHLL